MRKALLRLEDIGPGGYYATAEDHAKLAAVGGMLLTAGVPYHAAVISRYVDPGGGIDREITARDDAVSVRLAALLRSWNRSGVSLGMHGYSHQWGQAVSGDGYEFVYADCTGDCPPDDSPTALREADAFMRAYAYGKFRLAYRAFLSAGLRPDWFETPHYAASPVQRRIFEICSPVLYETNPDVPDSKQITARKSGSAYGRTYYVSTPLSYVGGASVERDTERILREAARYGERDLASFFYHPFLEFPYIAMRPGRSPAYGENSPLRRLIAGFADMGRRFVTVPDLLWKPG